MLKESRIALVAAAIAAFAYPAAAQAPDTVMPPQPAPQTTPGTPAPAAAPCGQRVERFIGSVLGQIGEAKPSTEAQRRALAGFKSAIDQAREIVRQACVDERSAATIKELEAAEKQLEAALDTLRSAFEKLYASLTDEQKAQFNMLGRQIETLLKDIWRDFALNFDLRPDADQRGARDQFRFCFEGFCFSMPRQFPNDRRDQRGRDEFRL